MNLYDLKKGEAIYVGADAPHAWLSGLEISFYFRVNPSSHNT
jgi:mannose-6-phosphate isomerase class I